MKSILILSALLLAGCATDGTSARLDGLEAELREVRDLASQALSEARAARQSATGTNADVQSASSLAQRALDAANQASERVTRIQDECCGVK